MPFADNGFAIVESVLDEATVSDLSELFDKVLGLQTLPSAGIRNALQRCPELRRILRSDAVAKLLSRFLSKSAFAVRAILFDKTPEVNWYVAWHQDTTIAVQSRHELPDYGPWSEKDGVPHVRPPVDVLRRMVALRLHLDPCGETNGPLRVIPGSHRDGLLSAEEIANLSNKSQAVSCTVDRGGCVVISPLIVHSSSKATNPGRRRVLHVEFADTELPEPLDWYERV